MARTLTNNFSLRAALESSLNTLPGSPSWVILEPNSIGKYGASIKTVARDPISQDRQRRKGTVVDLDSGVEYEEDLTISSFSNFIEGFCFAQATNAEMVIPVSAVDGSADSYTVAALTSTQAGKLQWESGGYSTLVYARGFANSANNGLKVLDADPASTDTAIGVTDTGLVDETVSGYATLELAGVRAKAGDLAITVSSGVATLTNGNNAVTSALDFTSLGLSVGQFIHVGGLASGQQFSAGYGYGRITSISATEIVLDKLYGTLATDDGSADTVDLLFGRFVKNVASTDASYVERSYHFEGAFVDLEAVGTDAYSYAKGNFCNEFTLSLELTDKATIGWNFVGTDTEDPTTSRKTNAASAAMPLMTEAFGTSSDIVRLRMTDTDETGLTTDFKKFAINVKNSVTADKVIATLGGKYMNAGNLEIMLDAEVLFTNPDLLTRMRANTTVTLDLIMENNDGAIAFDFPSMTIGDGKLSFPVNESVQIATKCEIHRDSVLGTSIGVSIFPIHP